MCQVDAFTSRLFGGNPAAVCLLEEWLPDALMQAIAAENNLSETAFVVREGDGFAIRWFTPAVEVDLCGHATLASAHVLFGHQPDLAEVHFSSQSGPLRVTRAGSRLRLDLPRRDGTPCPPEPRLADALGAQPRELHAARDLLAVFDSEAEVRALAPDMPMLAAIDRFGFIVTAPGRDCDFVSRYFAPREGVPEDPVTGSAHCTLVPYWAARLGKETLHARQVSRRGGELFCTLAGDRVLVAGEAVTFFEGTIELPG